MAIVQISRITNRKGLQSDLPQLAGAELGWSVDERRLFIGNGTLDEGAPAVGNTEILTEFSDILEFQTTYTYKGEAAGYAVQTGTTSNTPVSQSLQSWMDQWASVKDFGAVGDGVTDDTDAINRALYQLFCREVNPQIRRSLFFPAGVYLTNQTINIPPYATLYGEGADNSVIMLANGDDSSLTAYVARTADSLQQTGNNIGANGAIPPVYITISNLGFETADVSYGDVFLVERATGPISFNGVNFTGPFTTADLTSDAVDMSGVRFASSPALVCKNITFDRCGFSGTTFAIATDENVQGVTVSNCKLDTLYQGITIGTGTLVNGGPNGFRILHNFFNNIYAEGIVIGDVELNASGYNIFYDVGNNFAGTLNPATAIISIAHSNNISVGDLFERADAYATAHPRIDLENTSSIGFVNGKYIELGPNVLETESPTVLTNNTSDTTFYTFDATLYRSITINYSITRDTGVRHGAFRVVPTGGGTLTYDNDYVENEAVGITFSASQASDNVSITYTSTNTGVDGSLTYSISKFRV